MASTASVVKPVIELDLSPIHSLRMLN